MKCGVNRMFFLGMSNTYVMKSLKDLITFPRKNTKLHTRRKKNVCWPTIEIEKENL